LLNTSITCKYPPAQIKWCLYTPEKGGTLSFAS
jgi:hypothetical protein